MKVLLVTIGSYGDVHPFAGLGLTLKSRGHEPILFANGNFEHLATAAGIGFKPLGTTEEYLKATENPDLWHARKGTQVVMSLVMQSMRELYQLIADHYEPGKTIVVASSLAFAARIAQEKLKIPTITVHLQPAIFRTVFAPPKFPGLPQWKWPAFQRSLHWLIDRLIVDPLICPKLNTFRAELGLPPVSRIMKEWWHSPDRVIGFFPDWYAPRQPDWPPQTRLVGFPLFDEKGLTQLPAELDRFLESGEKPLVFTPGSAMFHADEFFEAAAAACQQIGRRGVLLTRKADQVPKNLPTSIRHFEYAPFSLLLPRAALLVHHGGIGTMSQAMAAGIPQLIMPMSHDQFDNADRVTKLGIGDSISVRQFRAPILAAKLNSILGSTEMSAKRKNVASKIEGVDALAAAAQLIEKLHDDAVTNRAHSLPV